MTMDKEKFMKDAMLTLTYVSDVNVKKLTKAEKAMFEKELLHVWNTMYVNCKDINEKYNK